jgi:hypothetical protein
MFLNILTLEPVDAPIWFLTILAGAILIPAGCLAVALNDYFYEEKTTKYSSIIAFIITACILYAIYIPVALIPSINKQKQYDEWYTNYHEEVLYDKIYSFDLSSSVFVVGYGHYSNYKDVSYYFYIEQENEPGTYKLTSIKFDDNVYIREVETNFNVTVFNRENSDKLEYYINVPKGTVTTTLNG